MCNEYYYTVYTVTTFIHKIFFYVVCIIHPSKNIVYLRNVIHGNNIYYFILGLIYCKPVTYYIGKVCTLDVR